VLEASERFFTRAMLQRKPMSRRSARLWKIIGGLLGAGFGAPLGYIAVTFLYVGIRTAVDPGFAPARADETGYVALAGALLAGALGAFIGVLSARVATGA
jgi:hypothetical protein